VLFEEKLYIEKKPVAPLLHLLRVLMVRVPGVVGETVSASRCVPITAVMGVLRLTQLIPAGCGVDDGAPAPPGVVVAETDIKPPGVLQRCSILNCLVIICIIELSSIRSSK